MASNRPKLHVTKTLAPNHAGAIRWAQKFGTALVVVRYRQDAMRLIRYTTVELVVDQAPIASKSQREVGVRISFGETELRAKARAAGATWDKAIRLWRMPLAAADALGLIDRVVKWPETDG